MNEDMRGCAEEEYEVECPFCIFPKCTTFECCSYHDCTWNQCYCMESAHYAT